LSRFCSRNEIYIVVEISDAQDLNLNSEFFCHFVNIYSKAKAKGKGI